MKLIIDIDENYYKGICKKVERFGKGSVVLSTPEKIMFNGISLEDIKAELNNLDFDFGNYYDETEAILNKINSVLDKYIKENKQ